MADKIAKDALRATVGMLRINYPKGTRVELIKMDDVQAPPHRDTRHCNRSGRYWDHYGGLG